jgi:hypothetical protein
MNSEVDPRRSVGKGFTRQKTFPNSVDDYSIITDAAALIVLLRFAGRANNERFPQKFHSLGEKYLWLGEEPRGGFPAYAPGTNFTIFANNTCRSWREKWPETV